MAEASESDDDVIPLNEETQIALPSDKNERRLALPAVIPSCYDVIPLNEETQIALPSDENERRLALPVVIPSFNLNKGTFDKPNFGPQTNTKHVEANTIEHATITNIHHHYGGDDKSEESPSTSGATGARPKRKLEKGFVQISEDIFMNPKKPLKKGLKIYEGYQEHVTGQRQPLAIKTVVPCTEKSIREVQHLVTLAPHPNVVRIIRSKEQETPLPTLYIAMELCGSKNLHDYLNENREKNTPFDFKKTMAYFKQLVKAMQHIHRNRIIHGDLKPENILFSLDGDQIKVSDFGISRELRQSCSATRITSQGTDGYRAPETYNSEVISMMADIFSLGVTMYCLFTNGKHPFGEDSDLWMYNIKKNKGRDLSGLSDEMGAKKDEFLDLLEKMLQVDPENRPTIEEVSKHPFLNSSQATAQASSIRQLSLGTSPKEALPELPFIAPTKPKSSFASEETQPKEGREAVIQMPGLGVSHLRVNYPEEGTHHVYASAQHHLWKPSYTRQLAWILGTSPEDVLPELPFVSPTTPESFLAFEETWPKESREAIMQRPDLGLSHLRVHSPEEATYRVRASAQARPKKAPGHLHRMASSDSRDNDPWRKRLRVTNIPRHLSSYKALSRHFKRLIGTKVIHMPEFLIKDERSFACITFHNHRDALAAKYGAAGLDQNLVIEWDGKEDPAVNIADSYPSSKIRNPIVDGRKNSIRTETLKRMKNLGMDVDKLNVWRVIVKSNGASATYVIRNMDRGCRICSSTPFTETRFLSEKVKINGEERLIYKLDIIKLSLGLISSGSFNPGIVVWFDHKTLQLFADNLASIYEGLRITSNLDPEPHLSLLPEKISVPIFSIMEFIDWIERKKRGGGKVTGGEGVEIKPAYSWFSTRIFTIRIIPEGILPHH